METQWRVPERSISLTASPRLKELENPVGRKARTHRSPAASPDSLTANEAQGWHGWAEEQTSQGDADTWYHDRHLMYHDDDVDIVGDDEEFYRGAPGHEKALSGGGVENDGALSATRLSTFLVYGLVNTVMAVPAMYGYAAVIFRDPLYATSMPTLSKLVCWSSAVHQVCFMGLSAMPFAIGQVQDAGLIFLSHMASNVATHHNALLANDDDDNLNANDQQPNQQQVQQPAGDQSVALLSTAVVLLGLSTACLGLLLVVVGRARLAKFVAYLPMPVISGYLAFIGFFCIEAGMSLCTSQPLTSLDDWLNLVGDEHSLVLCFPGLLAGLLLCVVSRKATHEAALPACMLALPLAFYLALFAGGWSLADARAFGWVGPLAPSSPPPPSSSSSSPDSSTSGGSSDSSSGGSSSDSGSSSGSVIALVSAIDFSAVDWGVVPQQLPVFCSMVIVVAFSSCLDVAAIEMDNGAPLDVNSELTVVGWSNVASGLLGGFTGSYIFSQTVFTCRSGAHSRIVGAVVAAMEFGLVFADVDLLAWVPLFFFAATLIFIGFDLLAEWLLDVRHKLEPTEYLLVLFTFAAIEIFGLNEGLALGVLGAAIQFLLLYANQSHVIAQVSRQSMVLRPPAASAVVHRHYQRGAIATLELRGALFFGSSLKILDEVKNVLNGSPSSSSSASSSSSSNVSLGVSSSSSNGSSSTSTSSASNGSLSALLNGPFNFLAPQGRHDNAASPKDTPATAGQDTRTANSGYFRVPPGEDDSSSSSFDSSLPPAPPLAPPLPLAAAPRMPSSQPPKSPRGFGEGAPGTWNSCVMVRHGSLLRSPKTRPSLTGSSSAEDVGIGAMPLLSLPPRPDALPESLPLPFSVTSNRTTANGSGGGSYGATENPKHSTGANDSSSGSGSINNSAAPNNYPSNIASSTTTLSTSTTAPVKEGTNRPRFLVLDFTHVASIDATAVHSCFAPVGRLSQTLEVKVVYAGCLPEVASQLDKHGAFGGDHVRSFPTLLRALDWCESVVIARARRNLNRAGVMPPKLPAGMTGAAMMTDVGGGGGGGGASALDLIGQGNATGANTDPSTGLRIKVPLAQLPDASSGAAAAAAMDFPMPASPGSTLVASQQQSVIKVGTLLRQWLELRPEVPPTRVRPWLYIGGAHHACDRRLLDRLDIGYVLNASDDIRNFFEHETAQDRSSSASCTPPPTPPRAGTYRNYSHSSSSGSESESNSSSGHSGSGSGGSGGANSGRSSTPPYPPPSTTGGRRLSYCQLGVRDYGQDPGIIRVFGAAARFAAEAKDAYENGSGSSGGSGSGGNLLIHCRFGMNRSPTVATAVLMQLEGLSLKEAWEQVKKAHHSAFPQPDNRAALVRYERLQLQAARDKQRAENRRQRQQREEQTRATDATAAAAAAAATATAATTSDLAAASAPVDARNVVQELFRLPGMASEQERGGAAATDSSTNTSTMRRTALSGRGAPLPRSRANSTGGSRAIANKKMSSGKGPFSSLLPDEEDDDDDTGGEPLIGSMGADDFKAHGVDDAEQLSRYCRTETFGPDEALFRAGDHADEFYLLLGGTVDLVRSDGVVKMSLSTGNVFGFVDSQLGKPRGTTAYARAPPGQLALQGNNNNNSSSSSSSSNDFNGGSGDGNGGGGTGSSSNSAGARSSSSPAAAVKVAVISMASLERMSADYPSIAVKLMKVLLRQSSLELSNS